jgi:hypothetical protein
MLGIVLMSTLAVIAVGGAASASAEGVVLCKVNKDPCPKESLGNSELYGFEEVGKTKIKTELSVALTGVITTECSPGKLVTKFNASLETPRLGETYLFYFFTCNKGCTVAAEKQKYATSLEATGGGNGRLLISEPKLLVNCGFGLVCTYAKAKPVEVTVKGGEPASLSVDALMELQPGGGILCPSTATWHGIYEHNIGGPSTYVTHG